MSSTNKTTNLQLSQFIGGDKPTWLGDINGDMVKIDTGVATAIETADNAEQTASGLQSTVSGLQTTVSGHTTSISGLQSAQTTQGNAINDLASDQAATESIVSGLSAKVGAANISSVAPDISQAILALASSEGSDTVLWVNPSPLVAFPGQVITLSDLLSNYQYYEVIYANGILAASGNLSSGRIPVGKRTILSMATSENYYRSMSSIGNNTMTWADGQQVNFAPVGTVTNNSNLVPIKVIGIK